MTHLRVKLRIVGSKHYKFKQILILNKLTKIRGKLFEKLGFWDSRPNKLVRFVVLNVYKLMYYYSRGLTFTKRCLQIIYYYLIKTPNACNNLYFKKNQIKLILENEIKKKFNLSR
jgi:ribosomal protein S16